MEALGNLAATREMIKFEQPCDEEVYSLLMLSSVAKQASSEEFGSASDDEEEEEPIYTKFKKEEGKCFHCDAGGTDLTCNTCNRAYHSFCTTSTTTCLSEFSWECSECTGIIEKTTESARHKRSPPLSPRKSPTLNRRKKQRKRCVHIEWKDRIEALTKFKEQFGHVLVWRSWKGDNIGDFNLGMWVSNIRQAYKRGELQHEKIKQLEELGFAWKANKAVSYREKIHNQMEQKKHNDDDEDDDEPSHSSCTLRDGGRNTLYEPSKASNKADVRNIVSPLPPTVISPTPIISPSSSLPQLLFDASSPPVNVDPESYFAYYSWLSKQNASKRKRNFSARKRDSKLPGDDSAEEICATPIKKQETPFSADIKECSTFPLKSSSMLKISALINTDDEEEDDYKETKEAYQKERLKEKDFTPISGGVSLSLPPLVGPLPLNQSTQIGSQFLKSSPSTCNTAVSPFSISLGGFSLKKQL